MAREQNSNVLAWMKEHGIVDYRVARLQWERAGKPEFREREGSEAFPKPGVKERSFPKSENKEREAVKEQDRERLVFLKPDGRFKTDQGGWIGRGCPRPGKGGVMVQVSLSDDPLNVPFDMMVDEASWRHRTAHYVCRHGWEGWKCHWCARQDGEADESGMPEGSVGPEPEMRPNCTVWPNGYVQIHGHVDDVNRKYFGEPRMGEDGYIRRSKEAA